VILIWRFSQNSPNRQIKITAKCTACTLYSACTWPDYQHIVCIYLAQQLGYQHIVCNQLTQQLGYQHIVRGRHHVISFPRRSPSILHLLLISFPRHSPSILHLLLRGLLGSFNPFLIIRIVSQWIHFIVPNTEPSAIIMCFCLLLSPFSPSSRWASALERASLSNGSDDNFCISLRADAIDSWTSKLKLNQCSCPFFWKVYPDLDIFKESSFVVFSCAALISFWKSFSVPSSFASESC